MNSRQRRALFAVAILLGAALAPVGALTYSYLIPTNGTVPVGTSSGLAVYVGNGRGVPGPDPWIGDSGVRVVGGRVVAPGDANVTLPTGQLNDTKTRTTNLDVSQTTVTLAPTNKVNATVAGDADEFWYRNITASDIDDSTVDFRYQGTSGTTTITFNETNVGDGARVGAVDQNGALLATTTVGADGNLSFTGMPNSEHKVTMESGDAPEISNVSPTGKVSDQPITFSADIDDPDFPSDNVTVDFVIDGTVEHTETLDDTGTATYTVNSGLDGGDHTFNVTAEDRYGIEREVNKTFALPSTLEIRNETNASELVDSPTEVQVQFFADNGTVFERSTTNGKIDMSGLPVMQDFVVTADADGYYQRRIYIRSIFQQQEVYLLSKNETAADIVFELDDKTGRFPAESTTLFIEKPINRSNTTKFRTVAADQFGATGAFPVTLQAGQQRYRLRVRNEQGDSRVLGSYTVTGDAREVLTIGRISADFGEVGGTAFDAGIIEDSGQRAVRIAYRDSEAATDTLRVEVHRYQNQSNTLVSNQTVTVDGQEAIVTYPIPASEPDNATYRVRYHADRTGAQDVGGSRLIGDPADLGGRFNMDPAILQLLGYLSVAMVTGLTVILDARRLAPMSATVTATGLQMLGILQVPSVVLAMAGFAALLFAGAGRVTP